jgi:hypothetical protein
MSNAKGRPTAIAWATALALVVPVSEAYVRAVSGIGPRDPWKTFTAEVTIRRGLRDSAHPSARNDGPAVKYRWERTQSGARWKSTMVVVGGTRPDIVAPTGTSMSIPPVVTRIEDDGDGTEPRFYDVQGHLLRLPTRKDRQKMGASESVFASTDALGESQSAGAGKGQSPSGRGPDWVEALMPSLEGKSARRAALQKRFGTAVGKVRGLSRYLQTVEDQTTEVLADDEWGVPVEINTVRSGALQSHVTFEYEAGPKGSLVRRHAHVEHAIADRPERKDARMVLDVELSNVTLSNVTLEDRR